MATIREVAKKAGVSITTVSRILNNDDSFYVSKSTKEKVLKTVKQLNYVKKRKKNKISQSNIAIIKCFDEKIENEDPYFVSLKINLENMLRKIFFKIKNPAQEARGSSSAIPSVPKNPRSLMQGFSSKTAVPLLNAHRSHHLLK